MYLTLPIQRGIHDIHIQEQPWIYLPWFFWIWDRRRKATAGSPVVYGEESRVERSRRSAACYMVDFPISVYILTIDGQFCGEKFCFVLNNSRPLLPLETAFFDTARARKGYYNPIFQIPLSQINVLQYPSSQSSPSSMIWWLRSMTSIKMSMSIAKLRRKKWKRNSENHCMRINYHHVQMSASKVASVG